MLSKLLHEDKKNTTRRWGRSLEWGFFKVMALEMRGDISLKDFHNGGYHTPGYYNEVPWTVWHINNRIYISQLWRLEVQDQGSMIWSDEGLLPGCRLPTSCCILIWQKKKGRTLLGFLVFFFIKTLMPFMGSWSLMT